jgi:hypothetical protein
MMSFPSKGTSKVIPTAHSSFDFSLTVASTVALDTAYSRARALMLLPRRYASIIAARCSWFVLHGRPSVRPSTLRACMNIESD